MSKKPPPFKCVKCGNTLTTNDERAHRRHIDKGGNFNCGDAITKVIHRRLAASKTALKHTQNALRHLEAIQDDVRILKQLIAPQE